MVDINQIPNEILVYMMRQWIDAKAILQLGCCQKKCYNLASETQLWKDKMTIDFPQWSHCRLKRSIQSYKWMAWISQQSEKFNQWLDWDSQYEISEKLIMFLIQTIIEIGPQSVTSIRLVENEIKQSDYDIEKEWLKELEKIYSV